jgi:hypothetical protein
VTTAYVHGRVRVQGVDFAPHGRVTVRLVGRRASVMARATANKEGNFVTSFKWPKKKVKLVIFDGIESVSATFRPQARRTGSSAPGRAPSEGNERAAGDPRWHARIAAPSHRIS